MLRLCWIAGGSCCFSAPRNLKKIATVPRRPHDQPDVWTYWWFCWLHWHDDVGLCYHRTSDAADCTDIDTDILTLVLVQRVILELKMIPILILILTFIVLKCWSWSVWTRIIRKFFLPLLQDEVTVGSMAVRPDIVLVISASVTNKTFPLAWNKNKRFIELGGTKC